jgi:ankyrin repeat protein
MIFYGAKDLEEQIDKHGHVNVVDEFFGSALYAAVYSGNDQVTAKLLELGADPNATGGVFHSVLQLASSRGSTSTMHLLLQAGANVNEIGGLYGTPAAAAVIFNHKPALELLLAHGANPNLQPQSAGYLAAPLLAPLIRAAQCGNVEMVDRLLQVENLDLNIKSEHTNSTTALLVALENGHTTIAQRLVSDSRLDTQAALEDAASCGSSSIVRFLIEERCVPPDETALLYALEGNDFSARPIDERRRSADDTATYLLDKFPNFDPNHPSGFTGSVFDHAAKNGLENAVRIMLQKGVDLSQNAEGSCMSLALATRNGHATVVKLLLKHGADSTGYPGGWTPLLEAAAGGHADVIRVLLEQPGIDVNYRDLRGMTPVLQAAFNGQYDALRVLIESGGEVNAQSEYGVTALSIATSCGFTDVVRLLLSYGAQPDIERSPVPGTLRKAVAREDVKTAETLILGGADVNLDSGCSPLYMAVTNRDEAMVRLLLQREDIELDPRSLQDGRTPLELAMDEGYPELVALFLERGGAGQLKHPFVGEIYLDGVRARM